MGYIFPVVEAYVKYKRSARYDEVLEVNTMLKALPAAKIRIDYKILRAGDSEVLVEGHTVHSFINVGTGKPVRAPKVFLDAITAAIKLSPKLIQRRQEA